MSPDTKPTLNQCCATRGYGKRRVNLQLKRGCFNAAFSLTELIITILIIAILSSLTLPVIGMVKDTARTATCASNLRQFGIAFSAYLSDNDHVWPDGAWNWRIHDYVNEGGTISNVLPAVFKMGRCPNVPSTTAAGSPLNASYAYTGVYWNSLSSGPEGYFFAWTLVPSPPKIVSGRMVRTSEKCYLNEMWDPSIYSPMQTNWGKSQLNDQSSMRVHKNGSNFLFVDGHVQFLQVDSPKLYGFKQWLNDAMWKPYSTSDSAHVN